MDFVRLLQSLEEAIYEIVTWVLFLPKTFFKVITRPDWIPSYINEEFEKETDKRFQGFLSPVIFWLLIAVLPYSVATVRIDSSGSVITVGDLDPTVLFITTVLLMTIPASFAFILLRLEKLPLERDSLKRLLYMQCYPVAIVELLTMPLLITVAWQNSIISAEAAAAARISLAIGWLWFQIAEIMIIRKETSSPWWKSILIGTIGTIAVSVFFLVILILFALILLIVGAVRLP